MEDGNVLKQISALVDEEHHLLRQRGDGNMEDEEQRRLQQIEAELDQCWDYLRQRRGARDAGRDASTVSVRDAATVESYEQ